MKKNDHANIPRTANSEAEIDDQDIADLFRAQARLGSIRPGATLDARVLSAARQALSDSEMPRAPGRTRHRWFALAASVILGITVAPLLIQSPESELSTVENRGFEADTALSLTQTSPAADVDVSLTHRPGPPAFSAPELNEQSSSSPGIDRRLVPAAQSAAGQTTSRTATVSFSKVPTVAVTGDTATGAAASDYRETPDDWMAHLRQLQKTGQTELFVMELRLFRQRFPDHVYTVEAEQSER